MILDTPNSHLSVVGIPPDIVDLPTHVSKLANSSAVSEENSREEPLISYKIKFQPTVALSPTQADFMVTCNVGRICLCVRSILWDLDIPHEAATVAFEDSNGCIPMGKNAQKSTSQN
jgi:hypothetical protein